MHMLVRRKLESSIVERDLLTQFCVSGEKYSCFKTSRVEQILNKYTELYCIFRKLVTKT
jgi:hypothetical protein